MASAANFSLMALILLLAISQQALSIKSDSTDSKKPDFSKSDGSFHNQGDGYGLNMPSLKKKKFPPIHPIPFPLLAPPPPTAKASPFGSIPSPTSFNEIAPKTSYNDIDGKWSNSPPLPPKTSPFPPKKPPVSSIPSFTPNTGNGRYTTGGKDSKT